MVLGVLCVVSERIRVLLIDFATALNRGLAVDRPHETTDHYEDQ